MGWTLPIPDGHRGRPWLIHEQNAEPLELDARDPWPPPEGKALVCVELGMRGDIAHLIYSSEELTALIAQLTGKPKHWLLLPLARAMELAGFPATEKP